jgi:F0F1-type ATP synthase membrane subunit b/b'
MAVFQVQFMDDSRILGFVLGVAIAFGLTILLLQKLVWEPLSLWLRKRYP